MDHYTVVTSLKRLDKKFTEQLSQADKKAAFNKFKRLYAQEMAKLASQISKRQKIQQNLNQVNEKEINKAKDIDQGIRRKMEKSTLNREKHQENMEKEIKMLDENWKRKMEQIARKNKDQSKEAFRKAERIRKQAEQFWTKKKSYTARQTQEVSPPSSSKPQGNFLNVPSNYLHIPVGNSHNYIPTGLSKKEKSFDNKTFNSIKTEDKHIKFLLPDLKKVKLNTNTKLNQNKTLNESVSEPINKNEDIRAHLNRTEQTRKEEQQAKFQKIMQKLDKIEKTRQTVQEKMEQEVKQAKRIRELRESPQVHAANRQRSIEQLHSKSRKKRLQKSLNTNSKELVQSLSKSRLSKSIQKHLQNKKRIEQQQFNQRESVYEMKKQKLRQGKINRLIKQAINKIKHTTLNDRQ